MLNERMKPSSDRLDRRTIRPSASLLAGTIATLSVLLAPSSALAEVLCDGQLTGVVNDNVLVISGECIIDRDSFINGNIEARGGFLRVKGTINGNIEASGEALISLRTRALVFGNVVHEGGSGGVEFTGNKVERFARIVGSIELGPQATMSAWGRSPSNLITGNVNCATPIPGGTETDWDGDGSADGVIFGNYQCAADQ